MIILSVYYYRWVALTRHYFEFVISSHATVNFMLSTPKISVIHSSKKLFHIYIEKDYLNNAFSTEHYQIARWTLIYVAYLSW